MEHGPTPGSVFLHPRDGSPYPPSATLSLPDTSQTEKERKNRILQEIQSTSFHSKDHQGVVKI